MVEIFILMPLLSLQILNRMGDLSPKRISYCPWIPGYQISGFRDLCHWKNMEALYFFSELEAQTDRSLSHKFFDGPLEVDKRDISRMFSPFQQTGTHTQAQQVSLFEYTVPHPTNRFLD